MFVFRGVLSTFTWFKGTNGTIASRLGHGVEELKVAVNQPNPIPQITTHFLILLVPFSQLIYFAALFKMFIEKGTSWSWIEGLWGIPGFELAPTGGCFGRDDSCPDWINPNLVGGFKTSGNLFIKLEHFPTHRDENQTYAKTTTTYIIMGMVIHQE